MERRAAREGGRGSRLVTLVTVKGFVKDALTKVLSVAMASPSRHVLGTASRATFRALRREFKATGGARWYRDTALRVRIY